MTIGPAVTASVLDGAPPGAVGILGGTFDPVHVGHLAVAAVAHESLDLGVVLFVPARQPPHKLGQPVTDARHREAMVRLALERIPYARLSRLELERPGPSWAVETVRHLADESAEQGRPEPWFILSSEALRGLPDWRDPEGIVARCRIAVVPRPGVVAPDGEWLERNFPGRAGRFAFLAGPHVGVAATEIRQRVARGLPIAGLVPPAVEAYIMRHHLYEPAAPRRP